MSYRLGDLRVVKVDVLTFVLLTPYLPIILISCTPARNPDVALRFLTIGLSKLVLTHSFRWQGNQGRSSHRCD